MFEILAFLAEISKLEKVLKSLSIGENVIKGKISVGDIAVLTCFVMFLDKKTDCESEFRSASPTSITIVENLMKDAKVAKMVEEARKIPYFPF